MKYEVNFTDAITGATSAIDNITAPVGYTAEQYIEDCEKNADDEWNTMLEGGEITLLGTDCTASEVEEAYGDYIATLEQDEKLTAEEWEAWIRKEAEQHDEIIYDCVVDAIIQKLSEDGYVINTLEQADDTYEASVALMDDEIREELHREMAPCTNKEFLQAYKKRHFEKYGEEFTI